MLKFGIYMMTLDTGEGQADRYWAFQDLAHSSDVGFHHLHEMLSFLSDHEPGVNLTSLYITYTLSLNADHEA